MLNKYLEILRKTCQIRFSYDHKARKMIAIITKDGIDSPEIPIRTLTDEVKVIEDIERGLNEYF